MRLCRLMCGKAGPFRLVVIRSAEAPPPATLLRHSLIKEMEREAERPSLSAHRAAQPQNAVFVVNPHRAYLLAMASGFGISLKNLQSIEPDKVSIVFYRPPARIGVMVKH